MLEALGYKVEDLVPYIDWNYFFFAWGIPARFASAAGVHDCPACRAAWLGGFSPEERGAAAEAQKLMDEARCLLGAWRDRQCAAAFALLPAWSEGNDICVLPSEGQGGNAPMRLPMLRRQVPDANGCCLSLADYISPVQPAASSDVRNLPPENVLGLFAASVREGDVAAEAEDEEKYGQMLCQTLKDRLAEATAEKLHEDVRRIYWAYAPEERLAMSELFAVKYRGIRPAVGYPSLPDQSIIFLIDRLLPFSQIGVRLTENGMMQPHASVAGLMLSHPAAEYFSVGQIDGSQLADYAARRGMAQEQLRKYFFRNISSL
ncbi:MAG: vitamin B12 dependent-methionine synthase activation domain-containing protein [Alloprevotella sp.]|nr:vitamin B12 dependent-methionine synthase activation domain-containing protein [Alloprevotella sp.]